MMYKIKKSYVTVV